MEDDSSANIGVFCRFRPLNAKEIELAESLSMNIEGGSTVVVTPQQEKNEPMRFAYDWVFGPNSEQKVVYEKAAKPIVESVMKGFNGTVFAYGQTSSGKTFTMTGPSIEDKNMMGIIPRMVGTVFDQIENSYDHLEFTVKVSFAEIYMEKIKDLIDPSRSNLKVHEDRTKGIFISGLTEHYVSSDQEVYDLMKVGTDNREVGYTDMNAGSSRSHSLFIIIIAQNNTLDYSTKVGKLYLVDLAGSEKVSKTGAAGKRLEEAKNINKSLTVLGQVINCLTDGKNSHIPYRDSKLTRVLQDSLGGNSKTSLIITCSPSKFNEHETLSTLRFGIRAKAIKNKPKVNREYTVAELKLLLANAKQEISKKDSQIKSLKNALKGSGSVSVEELDEIRTEGSQSDHENTVSEEYGNVIQELEDTRSRLAEEVESHTKLKYDFINYQLEIDNLRNENENLSKEHNKIANFLSNQQNFGSIFEKYKKSDSMNLFDKVFALFMELQSKEDQIQDTNENSECYKVKLESAKKEVGALKSDNQELQEKLQLKEQELDNLNKESCPISEKQAVEKELVSMKKSLLEQEEIINNVQAKASEGRSANYKDFKELLESEKKAWDEEKSILEERLQSKSERIAGLESNLDKARQDIIKMRKQKVEADMALKKKVNSLEKNLEHLTNMYRELFRQTSDVKHENEINMRKLRRKEEKLEKLKKQLFYTREQANDYKTKANSLLKQIPYHRPEFPKMNNICKKIRGGSNARLQSILSSFPPKSRNNI